MHNPLPLCVLIGSALLGISLPATADTGIVNTDLCINLNQRTSRVAVKPVAKPPYLRLFKEPGFDTRVMRISNSGLGAITKPSSNASNAWNYDESRMMLHNYDSNGNHSVTLLDGHTYDVIGTLKLPRLAAESVHWSHQDANILFYMPNTEKDAGKLSKINIATGKRALIKDFAPYCKKSGVSAQGGTLAKPSNDDDLFGFRCGVLGGHSLALSYRVSNMHVSTLRTGAGTQWPIDSVPLPLPHNGNILLNQMILNSNLKPNGRRLDIADKNAPSAIGASNEKLNVFFQSAVKKSPRGCSNDIWNGAGLIVKHDLGYDMCASLVTQTKGWPSTPGGSELVANAYQNPRWLAMANVGYDNLDWFTERRGAPLLFSEIILTDTKQPEPKPYRLAHMRTYGEQASNASYDLSLSKPSLSLSPMATRVLFSSDWYDSGAVDTYVVSLPAYTRLKLQGSWIDKNNSDITALFKQLANQISFIVEMPHPVNGKMITLIGSGDIISEKMELKYQYEIGADRAVKGTCTGVQSSDKSGIVLDCLNDVYQTPVKFNFVRAMQ
ncbi:MAG: hypothetical protein V3U65_14945 [Granulosicoccaceae bacterium]